MVTTGQVSRSRSPGVPLPMGLLVALLGSVLLTACASNGRTYGARSAGGSWSATSVVSGSGSTSTVSCSGETCSVTLGGRGASASVLGTTLSIVGVRGGQATLRIDGRTVSFRQGEVVTSGALTLRCIRMTADTVTLEGSMG
jgi:hypothetical protein